ncbi:MAG: hypothetical protein HY880_09155, partial [Deltaproteobacteria bacterium]|nr:hypothetical protein [Deltaproteobacteria bacterium]
MSFVGLLLIISVYLGLKALPEESWSGWTTFTAQTMLSSKHWAEDGFIYSKFLFIPIGYSKAVRYLDAPEMRHHARGTVYGGLIGRRLYYTHYPSGYLVPYALLMKAGAEERHWFRLLSLSFSITALVFIYLFVNKISTPEIAFFSTLYYAGSTMFLDFADSLANQPLDDLFRFAILFLSIALLKNNNPSHIKRHCIVIWILYLMYSLTSYDSTFFIFFYLAGISYLSKKGNGLKDLPFGRWLFFASAPVAGFSLQMLQNWWYLGTRDMLLDILGIFFARANTSTDIGFFTGHLISMFLPLYYMTGINIPAALIVFSLIAIFFTYAKKTLAYRGSDMAVISILFLGGLIYTSIFSYTGGYDYEGRQLAPALGILVGSATVFVWRA